MDLSCFPIYQRGDYAQREQGTGPGSPGDERQRVQTPSVGSSASFPDLTTVLFSLAQCLGEALHREAGTLTPSTGLGAAAQQVP